MSVEAMTWALNLAPVPADAGGKPSDSCAFVLVGLANHAGPDGTGAFPSVKTLMRYTRMSERTIRTALGRLEVEGLIRPCDPDIVAAKIKRADRRPKGWDLAVDRVRTDLDDDEVAALEQQFPGLAARVADARGSGVQPPHPAREPVDNQPGGVQPSHPAESTGCNQRSHGVQRVPERGAAIAPEPSYEPPREPSATRAGARHDPPVDNPPEGGGGGDGVGAFFAALGEAWPLSAGQRDRLTPAVAAAVTAGWGPRELAAHVGANTAGVRNPYAVLSSRLADLPEPPRPQVPPAPARPPWCGRCDESTRQVEDERGRAARCPTCHPLAGR